MSNLNKEKRLSDQYDWVSCLLLYFLEDTYLPPETRDDTNTIKRFISEFDSEYLNLTITQGREVLAMDPFPHDWISNTTNLLVYDQEKKEWVDDPKLYKEWVSWILQTLEEEAKSVVSCSDGLVARISAECGGK